MAGRKGEKFWADAVRRAVSRRLEGEEGNPQRLEKLAEVLVESGLKGDMVAIKEIGDRLDGRPSQSIIGDEEQPLTVVQRIELVAASNGKD